MRFSLLVVAALSVTACGTQDEYANTFTAYGAVTTPATARVTVRAAMPGRTVVFNDEDIRTARGDMGSFARAYRIPKSGTMRVTISVTATSADTIALVEIPFVLASGHEYSVQVRRARANEPDYFLGPVSLTKHPLRGSARASTDSLWVFVGNGIHCRDCVY